jgi:hypothetical protein
MQRNRSRRRRAMPGAVSLGVVCLTLAATAGFASASSQRTGEAPGRADIAPFDLRDDGDLVDRSASQELGKSKKHNGVVTPSVHGTPVVGSNATISFDGSNFFDQRTLNGFSLEPPDQGLCVSRAAAAGGRVLEVVNDVASIYDLSGTQLKKQTLNSFFGYPELRFGGPELIDPSCYHDDETGAWFVAVLAVDVDPATLDFTGANHVDVLVSNPSNHDPSTTPWKLYSIPTENNGTRGTPNHHCEPYPGPPPPYVTDPDACIGDYPHIGADKWGFYVATNEYSFFGDQFTSAQIYALSKHALAANADSAAIPRVLFDDTRVDKEHGGGGAGFTVWPAVVPGTAYELADDGTEFFLSSTAAAETGNTTGSSSTIGVWAITNTRSIDSGKPSLNLSSRSIASEPYGVPPLSDQPHSGQSSGDDFPLGQCLNDTGCSTFLNGEPDPFAPEVIGRLDSNDSRMQQVYYAAGKVWGALDTRANVDGQERAAIAWFVVSPVVIGNGQHVGPQTTVVRQGYLAAANNDVSYPALAVNAAGKGVMAFTLTGPDYYPSAADVRLDATGPHGPIAVPGPGVGLQDGFTEYKYYAPVPPNIRERWGDYGAADEDAGSIWTGSEFIGQRCTFLQYVSSSPFGSCGGTRRAFGNWYTRISEVAP